MIGPEPVEREHWGRKLEFLFACIGFAVGYGNFWRFPYMCFRNGGGAFLIPYVCFLLLGGIPLFFMELSIGQILQAGPIKAWAKISPLFSGVGIAMVTVSFLVSVYYNVILAWSIYYLYNSFKPDIPWVGCHHTWNTDSCYEVGSKSNITNTTRVSSSREFFIHNVLDMSEGINEPGHMNLKLVACLFVAWVLVYFCIWKGIRTTGKVVYVTATLPYVFLIILFIRALTLPGSSSGMVYYVTPVWSRLADPKVWIDAASQILYSLTIGFGVLIGFASYNKKENNVYKDALVISLVNCCTSLFAGFVVFAVVGHMAYIQGSTPAEVASQGPGLVFIVYPATLAELPAPQIWSVIFFLMLITLGLDSQFGQVEVVAAAIIDQYPEILHRYREVVVLAVCLIMFVLGLPCVTQGGIYVFNLLDSFSAGISLLFLVIFELMVVGWIYGAQNFAEKIARTIGYPVSKWWVICWKFVSPVMVIGIFLFSVIKYQPLTYEERPYPKWAEGLGWIIACASMLCVPITAVKVLCNAEGSSLERLQSTTFTEGVVLEKMESNKGNKMIG
ncbi:sodium- and chloride-dependent GABA transporter 1-like [Pocillopora verrucosa]|uniref:sodium- and chloride-dependent GABA transporter 1-like n=1 Tax=Pocillopora verrucosa TaxID=203993 RepID=UPI00333E403B